MEHFNHFVKLQEDNIIASISQLLQLLIIFAVQLGLLLITSEIAFAIPHIL